MQEFEIIEETQPLRQFLQHKLPPQLQHMALPRMLMAGKFLCRWIQPDQAFPVQNTMQKRRINQNALPAALHKDSIQGFKSARWSLSPG